MAINNDIAGTRRKSDKLECEIGLDVDSLLKNMMYRVNPEENIRTDHIQYSISKVKAMQGEINKLIVNTDRKIGKPWDIKKKCDFIETILTGVPIPAIYLFEDKKGRWTVVDGRHRIAAITEFLDNEFALQNLRILNQFNGKRFAELNPKTQGIFEDFKLQFYIIQPPTLESIKYIIFERINSEIPRLRTQEIREALYPGKATELLHKLSISREFKLATNNEIGTKYLRDRYVILRSLSFYVHRKFGYEIKHLNGASIIDYPYQ